VRNSAGQLGYWDYENQQRNPDYEGTAANGDPIEGVSYDLVRVFRSTSSQFSGFGFQGNFFLSTSPQNPPPNPNCITNAVAGGTLGTTRGLIPAVSDASGRPVPTGRAAHDGIHVYAGPGDPAVVTALPAMSGRILHSGRQSDNPRRPDYQLGMDILLNTRINGQQYVMTLKDLNYNDMQRGGTVRPGIIGSVNGSADIVGETGLHVTLMPYSTYQTYIGGRPSAAARNSVPFNSLMDAHSESRRSVRVARSYLLLTNGLSFTQNRHSLSIHSCA
jgi:hypothetical protein